MAKKSKRSRALWSRGRKPSAPARIQMTCPNCGRQEPHFVPPSMGDPGFFICTRGPHDAEDVEAQR
jgi:hypothetical protein